MLFLTRLVFFIGCFCSGCVIALGIVLVLMGFEFPWTNVGLTLALTVAQYFVAKAVERAHQD
jgi:putative flippase GtrA